MLEKYLGQLVADFRLDPLSPVDERGLFSLKLNNVEVSLKYLDPGVYFHSKIVQPLPQHKK